VRAGHGPYQGEAILDHLQDVVRVSSEDKIIVIVDAALAAKAASVVQGPLPTGKVVCVLVAPWSGIEQFVEDHLPDDEAIKFRQQREALSKRKLAELFADKLSRSKVRE
jgi:hypothetical protein